MEDIQSRSRARGAANWDFCITILSLVSFIYVTYETAVQIIKYNELKEEKPELEGTDADILMKKIIIVTYFETPFVGIFLCINIWATCMFGAHSAPRDDPLVALKKAVLWRNIGFVYILVELTFAVYIFTFEIKTGVRTLLGAVYRGVLISIVQGFINDLQKFQDEMAENQAGQTFKI